MEDGMTKSYIWGFINRFGHLALILSFSFAYFLVDFDSVFYYHAVAGVMFLALLLLRVIWGFVGTKHSRFKDFHYKGVFAYLLSILGKKQRFISHNPASSIAIIAMILLGIATSITGLLALGSEEGSGIFANLYFEYSHFRDMKHLHEFFANSLLGVVIIHICGSLIDKFFNKNDSLDSMISGYKLTQSDESITYTKTQKLFCLFYILSLLVLCLYLLTPKNSLLTRSPSPTLITYKSDKDFALYKKECGSCHIAYAPYLLPANAWEKMMGDLENHFGDDASLDEEDRVQILSFLSKNSLKHFDTKFQVKSKTRDEGKIAISEYVFYQKAHRKISQDVFTSKEIKSKANCQNCHKDAENGTFSKVNIDFAKISNTSK